MKTRVIQDEPEPAEPAVHEEAAVGRLPDPPAVRGTDGAPQPQPNVKGAKP